jgi:hypothetical protein
MANKPAPHILRLIPLIATVCFLGSCATVRHSASPKGSLHQIGFVWLKDAGNTADQQKVIDAVHDFGREIPEVKSVAVGKSDGIGGPFSDASYDVSFILTFENDAARLRYNAHPVHEKAAKEVFLPLSQKLLFYRFVGE